jgi:hypothetical protein
MQVPQLIPQGAIIDLSNETKGVITYKFAMLKVGFISLSEVYDRMPN